MLMPDGLELWMEICNCHYFMQMSELKKSVKVTQTISLWKKKHAHTHKKPLINCFAWQEIHQLQYSKLVN